MSDKTHNITGGSKMRIHKELRVLDVEHAIVGFDVEVTENGETLMTASVAHHCDVDKAIKRAKEDKEFLSAKHFMDVQVLFAEFYEKNEEVSREEYEKAKHEVMENCEKEACNIIRVYIGNYQFYNK